MTDHSEICGAPSLPDRGPERPRVTLALFAYNQENYVRAAVEGALEQGYEPLEIILSDDGSRDATFAIMQETARAYEGQHHVRLNRNDTNLGLAAHVNRVLAMAQGEIIVIAAGDDISLPDRVAGTVAAFARHPDAMAVSFVDVTMDADGNPLSTPDPTGQETWIEIDTFLAAGPRAQSKLQLSGASRAFRRKVYDTFGDLMPDCPAEDSPFLRRALYLGPCIRCGWPGIRYRLHSAQLSTPSNIAQMRANLFKAQYMRDLEVFQDNPGATLSTVRSARYHIQSELVQFLLRGLKHTNSPPDLGTVLKMLPARGFSAREKLGLLKRFILRESLN